MPGSSLKAQFTIEDIHGSSPAITRLKEMAKRIAQTDFAVLLEGESGTGKELFAHALHNLSPRAEKPFLAINCAAIPEALAEAELFGYEPGAFTGARQAGKPGKLEIAHGGTVFLDEVSSLSLPLQAKLLRLLQYGEVEKIGGLSRAKVDVRIIAASNRPLREMVKEGLFREDLFYRLNVIHLEIPPLRERTEDIPAIAAAIIGKLNRRYPDLRKEIAPEAMAVLQGYVWPGNVRELENVLQRLFVLVEGAAILPHHLAAFLPAGPWGTAANNQSLSRQLAAVERDLIEQALRSTGGNKARAARLLGMPRSSLYEKLKVYKLCQ